MNDFYPFVNTPLPYGYAALEPFIDEKTMRLHHDKHLQTYINNLNAVLKEHAELRKYSLEQLITCNIMPPSAVRTNVRRNAGGVYNHRFFFYGLKNPSSPAPTGALARAINGYFGSFDKFRTRFTDAALSVFGSGYAWLVRDGRRLAVVTSANQDTPLCNNVSPLLCIDVWEHAYYLKHCNVRADYVDDFFEIIDWARADALYSGSK